MSVTTPAFRIKRWSVVGMEGMYAKMFDPPKESPATPDEVPPTNPVPEVMAAAGFQNAPKVPHTVQRDLLHGMKMPTWDSLKQLFFYTFRDADNPATGGGNFPGATIRVPRGVVFHCETSGLGPPPHTIHWHGIEPTPMNDGVGHCSMELGHYIYQFQPNFIGTYFYHCHRNTMQHFEFGLYGLLLIEPPDAYFATLADPSIAIGHCRDGKRRTAANLTNFPQFPGFNGNLVDAPDPWTGNPALKFATDPHAMTVPYDVEALWVFDDRDSVWSDLAPDARATFPRHGSIPGVDDDFTRNPGKNGFFAFNDFNADYWFVTGVPVPTPKGGTAAIPANVVIPPQLNSGITGTQVSINAHVNQTILIRALDGAYNSTEVTFPLDVVIIAWDGRALGQPPYGHNEAYLVPANTPIRMSTARRFDALIRTTAPFTGNATVKFINTRGELVPGLTEEVTCTALIPINITAGPGVTLTSNVPSPQVSGGSIVFSADASGGSNTLEYRFWLKTGGTWTIVQPYGAASSWTWNTTGLAAGAYAVQVDVRTVGSTVASESSAILAMTLTTPVTSVALASAPVSSQPAGTTTPVVFTANAAGGIGNFEYRFWLNIGGIWSVVQPYGANTWSWDAAALPAGKYLIQVDARNVGSTAEREAATVATFVLSGGAATDVKLLPSAPSPQKAGAQVIFAATGSGGPGSGPFEYRFWLKAGGVWKVVQQYGANATWLWDTATLPAGSYAVQVDVRTAGSTVTRQAVAVTAYNLDPAPPTAVDLATGQKSPVPAGNSVTFTAQPIGGGGALEYRFWLKTGTTWAVVQAYGASPTWTWNTTGAAPGNYAVQVDVRSAGTTVTRSAAKAITFGIM